MALRLDHADVTAGSTVRRWDRLDPRLPKAERTREGFLRALATPVARTGVLEYHHADGTVQRELRLPEHVFDAKSMASLDGKPVIHLHVPRVDAANAAQHVRGAVASPRQVDEFLVVDLTIHDARTIEAAERGSRELSAGYSTVLIPIPGGVFRQDGHPFDGTAADFLQTEILYNHVALLPRGRANEGRIDRPIRLRLDGYGDQIGPWECSMENTIIIVNGLEYAVPPAVARRMEEMAAELSGFRRNAAREDGADPEATRAPKKDGPPETQPSDPAPAEGAADPNQKAAEPAAKKADATRSDGAEMIKIGEKTFETQAEADDYVAGLERAKTDAEKAKTEAEARADASDGELKKLKDEATNAETQAKQATIEAERFGLLREAVKVAKLDEANAKKDEAEIIAELTKKSDADLRRLILSALNPELKLDGKDDVYVAASLDWHRTQKKDAASQMAQAIRRSDGATTAPEDKTDGAVTEGLVNDDDAQLQYVSRLFAGRKASA